MPKICASFCRKPLALATCGLVLALFVTDLYVVAAEARQRDHRHGQAVSHAKKQDRRAAQQHHVDGRAAATRRPPAVDPQTIAAIVVDANSGRILYARGETELRHPASITKVMTLYLLFEQIERGRLRLDSMIPISSRAAAQAPTKLGLRAGAAIRVDDAIKAVVTRSANDIAVAIAEEIGGDEKSFAEMMTSKAHALGMTRTNFANASGLPDAAQITTAADLALLGRAIEDHFPRYYPYFATRSFTYKGTAIRNHNHLLERVEGMDGIKTGYTRASGFNLLTSVKRNGRYIVAVVLGGRSAGHRDRIMADLIEKQIVDGARVRTAAAVPLPVASPSPAAVAKTVVASVAPDLPTTRIAPPPPPPPPERKIPFVPVTLKPGLTVDTAPARALAFTAPSELPRPAYVAASPRPRPDGSFQIPVETIPPRRALDGSTSRVATNVATLEAAVTPSTLRRPRALVPPEDIAAVRPAARPSATSAEMRVDSTVRGNWMIQIAATNDLAKANDLLARAKQEGARALDGAKPTTQKIQKGSETLYRVRFVGLEAETAETACKTLKRSGFACFAARN